MCRRVLVDQVLMHRWARQQDNRDPPDAMFPRKRGPLICNHMFDAVSALWMQTSRKRKKKTEDVQVSNLFHNEDVKKWLESMEDPETN